MIKDIAQNMKFSFLNFVLLFNMSFSSKGIKGHVYKYTDLNFNIAGNHKADKPNLKTTHTRDNLKTTQPKDNMWVACHVCFMLLVQKM